MEITDINGCLITVTDLEAAIKQADEYRHYKHKDKSYSDFEKQRNAYWTDIYHKLLEINNLKLLKRNNMSNLSKKTEYKALTIIAGMVKEFGKLYCLDMTRDNERDARLAECLLEGIVQSNGYEINYDKNIKKSILKQ
jgi:hypothetical protein